MKTQSKKGFTIVELVIVIAVIAILAAVLIPTFINLTKKANESNTTALLRNLNVALANDKALNGEHKTAHSAVLAAKAAGYDLPTIAKEQTEAWIVWDADKDEFVKETENGSVNQWKIYDKVPETQTYSIYWIGEAKDAPTTVSVGFDAGDTTGIAPMTYNGDATVTIRTNGGTLTVDNANATVYHYGTASLVDIVKCATASYHEFGNVMRISLKYGHVVAENGSRISQINIPNGADANNVEINVKAMASVPAVTSAISVPEGKISIENEQTAFVSESDAEYPIFVGKKGFQSLSEAIRYASSGQTVLFMKDYKQLNEISTELSGKELVFDINGHQLKFPGFNCDVVGSTQNTTEKLTFIDSGSTKGEMNCVGNIAIFTGPNDSLTLDGVTLNCKVYGLYPRGNAAYVEVRNSHISASVYALATNASNAANGGVSILIDNSIIETSSSDQDNTAVQINVPSTTLIKNSTISGQRQALMIRGGSAKIENTVISKTVLNGINDKDYSNRQWESGNEVPAYALVLGNRSNSYQYPTNVSMSGVTVDGGIYSWGNSVAGLGTVINFGSGCYGELITGENVTVSGVITKK